MVFISIRSCSILLRLVFFVLLHVAIFSITCKAQKLLPDTIFVRFRSDSLIDTDRISIVEINDERDENPRFVRFGTKNKYLFFPVDYEIYTKRPLTEAIRSGISADTGRKFNYVLDIKKFEIETKKQRFSRSVYLVADIPVFKYAADTNLYLGTLYYDYLYLPEVKKESPAVSTENLLSKWHTDFKIDLLTLNSVSIGASDEITPNFIDDPKVRSLYLNALGGTFIGYNWWGIQGEVYFTRPETNIKNRYTAGILRYQDNPDYESFAIGKNSEHYTLRKNRNLMLDADLNILLFDVEVSSVQSILYNPLNSSGITARIGLIENISYIIDKKLKVQAGLFMGIGFKL